MSTNEDKEKKEVKIEILSVYPILSMNPNEFGRRYYVVIARADTGDIVSVKIPVDEYSRERLTEEIKRELQELRAIKEQEIRIEL